MKRILWVVFLAIALCTFAFTHPVAADTAADTATDLTIQGAKVFTANCAACHMNGGNVIMATKNLKNETLKQNGMDSEAAIIQQVTNGKNAMPAFKGRLNQDQIKAVAAYVLDKSTKGW